MNILVTGGAGYIGSHTVNQLIQKGHNVTIIDNLSTGHKEALNVKAKFYELDLTSAGHLSNILIQENIELVIHFAAKLVVEESVANPDLYYFNNVVGTLNLLNAMNKAQVKKIVFSSTAAVYGQVESEQPHFKLTESFKTLPINPYGQSKLMCEAIIQDFAQAYQFEFVILRYFNVAGAADDGENGHRILNATHLIKVVAECATNQRKSVKIFGNDYKTVDGTGVRDYIHVEDLAEVHVLASEKLGPSFKNEIFNCGYGSGYSVLQIIHTFEKLSQQTLQKEFVSRRAGDPAEVVASPEKVFRILNWKPQRNNIVKICESALKWEIRQLKIRH